MIEILTVISIIALLVSVFLPALHQARLRGQKAVCASRIRQLTMAAVQCALSDRNEKLPAGGLLFKSNASAKLGLPDSFCVYPPPPRSSEPAGDLRIEDATMLSAQAYFQLASQLFGRGDVSVAAYDRDAVNASAQRYHLGQMQKIFVCPSAENKGDTFESDLPLFAGQPQHRPAIVRYAVGSRAMYAVQTGYWYFGGFETDRWSLPQRVSGFMVKPYRAPTRLSDSGQAALFTDPVTIWPSSRQFVATHTARGYVQHKNAIFARPDIKTYAVGAVSGIGTLDGAVEHKPLEALFYRAAYAENGALVNDLMTMF